MSDFIVSARKYRPTTFDAVVGQFSITSTLKSAIKLNQLAQSFLFCGPRGVGKTSCARILAKTINCEAISDNIEACNKCVSCKSFNEKASFNVHELDAASNNSVDDIRKLVDQVRFAPQVGQYDIYIIDEVHMLSTSAFNAFLKTLEEPPAHAKFILATTEKQKIIPTILSRCQIFDFKRVGVKDITNHLAFVAENEGVTVEKDALHLIAQKSDGALRDSLSLFDRMVSFSDRNLSYNSVVEHLNILDYDYYFKITNSLLENDINQLLNIYNEILENGFDGHQFINGLAKHLRDLLVSKDESTIVLLEKGDKLKTRYLEQAKKCELNFIFNALNLCNDCDIQYKGANNQRLLVELTLMRISSINTEKEEKKNSKGFVVSVNDTKKEVLVQKDIVNNNKEEQIGLTSSEVRPSIKIKLGRGNKKPSLISINSSLQQDKDKVEEYKTSIDIRDKDFSQEMLLEQWKDLILFVKGKGKSNLGITLGVHEPKILDGFLIEFPLSNAAQKEMFSEEKYIILDYLRNKLENDKIELKTIVTEATKDNIPYTSKEKFKKMLDQNSKLEKLRVELALDTDY